MNDNPYQIPAAELERAVEPGDNQLHDPRSLAAGRGASWFTEGWQLFLKAPVMLVVTGILMFLIFGVGSLIPVIGSLLVMLFWPHFSAGFYLAFRHAREGQPVAVGDLFAPLRNMGSLMALGGLYLAGSVILMIVIMALMFGGMGAAGMFGAISGGELDPQMMDPGTLGTSMLLAGLVTLALAVPYMMAFMFAPVLAHQHGLQAVEAVRMSFRGCLRNLVPFLVWGLVWLAVIIGLTIIGMIPLLGQLVFILFMLVVIPLSIGNLYVAYEDIFVR